MEGYAMKGYFITIEGPEGAGKTTVVAKLQQQLESRGFQVVITREPGGIKISEAIRNIILDTTNTNMDPKTEALLYAAARRQHLVEKIIPALEEGKIVLCDRFIDSSLAYQGYARNLGMEEVFAINDFAINGHMPELTLYFDIEPEIGLARINAHKNREINRLDLEALDFHHKVRDGYLKLVEKHPERIKMIDASKQVEEVLEDVTKVVLSLVQQP